MVRENGGNFTGLKCYIVFPDSEPALLIGTLNPRCKRRSFGAILVVIYTLDFKDECLAIGQSNQEVR